MPQSLLLTLSCREFFELTMAQQIALVKEYATFLIACWEDEEIVSLFSYNNFYIEVWCDPNTLAVKWIHAFDDPEELEPYLELGLTINNN